MEHADGELFFRMMFISTPVAQTNAEALSKVEAIWRDIGCRVERMTPEDHDEVFAAVSHLPHLLAFALLAQICRRARCPAEVRDGWRRVSRFHENRHFEPGSVD